MIKINNNLIKDAKHCISVKEAATFLLLFGDKGLNWSPVMKGFEFEYER